jgi:hypothetical protein
MITLGWTIRTIGTVILAFSSEGGDHLWFMCGILVGSMKRRGWPRMVQTGEGEGPKSPDSIAITIGTLERRPVRLEALNDQGFGCYAGFTIRIEVESRVLLNLTRVYWYKS